ncbi:P-loop containing nucleoside triphosphate hydrolase protein [Schizophyllum commune Loenen D]|nr:P-loop containing nucleoside triphosphate hydrolase protein [Schizophyllum commune Loenen D]
MSSDDLFSDIDDAALAEIDRIEAEATQKSKAPPPPKPSVPDPDDSYFDDDLDIPTEELARLDQFVEDAYAGKAKPTSKPVTASRQTTLFGDVLSDGASRPKPLSRASSSNIQRSGSFSRRGSGRGPVKTKQWDHTQFAKTGLKHGKSKGKGKARDEDEEEDEEEETIEFEQFPAPWVSEIECTHGMRAYGDLRYVPAPPPMKLKPDLLEAKHWIYPLNRPKRDYQFNIVKHCLFDNTIVALPTGLGKTFIAGVVMLNFYRWFPEGKVVFVAPTKPLVAQQIEASHKTCGIPGSDAVELTGNVPKAARERAWSEKRVFYMTPQTLLNDLTKGTCEALDIVLIVVDEAHRATGDYAYNQVVRYMMAKNPHFRLLALTATPGSTPEAVQNLIDGLHISNIEIRDEKSIDLRQYIHEKKIEQHIIQMDANIRKIRDPLARLMTEIVKPIENILRGTKDPCRINSFTPQAQQRELKSHQNWARVPLMHTSRLARIMGYLLEGTIGMCYNSVKEIEQDVDDPKKKGGKKLASNPLFKEVAKALEQQRRPQPDPEHPGGFSMHPKMEKVKSIIIDHFAQEMAENENNNADKIESRVMVFVTFREAVEEIVDALNFERPLIRATKFVGQGLDKKGGKGLAQKEQLATVEKFKAGEYNVLVATSIGEEGLDIGEVDLILQRLGRTGRKRAGVVHVLLAEGREELNLEKAKEAYKHVQQSITRGEALELYADVDRMLPDHIKPECLEQVMEIQEYVREEPRSRSAASRSNSTANSTASKKRKRNDDPGRNIPAGASNTFVSVKDLIVAGAKKRKTSIKERDFSDAGTDDEDDLAIEAGLDVDPSSFRRTASEKAPSSKRKTGEAGKVKRAATTAGTTKSRKKKTDDDEGGKTKSKGKGRKRKEEEKKEWTASQLARAGASDSDDMEVEAEAVPMMGFQSAAALHNCRRKTTSSTSRSSSPEVPIANTSTTLASSPSVSPRKKKKRISLSSSPERPMRAPINIESSPEPDLSSPRRSPSVHSSPAPPADHKDDSMAWLVDDDDDSNGDIEIVNSPTLDSSPPPAPRRSTSRAPSRKPTSPSPATDDSDIEVVDAIPASLPPPRATSSTQGEPPRKLARIRTPSPLADVSMDVSMEVDGVRMAWPMQSTPADRAAGPSKAQSSADAGSSRPSRFRPAGALRKQPSTAEEDSRAMPPPPIPSARSNLQSSPMGPPPSQPVRVPTRKRARVIDIPSDSPDQHNSPPRRRLFRREVSPSEETRRKQKGKEKAPLAPRKHNPLFDYAADHSGDEVSEGESGSEEEETEEDRRFLTEMPSTQASPSYQQTQAYMQGLMTQAPNGLAFGARPVRRGKFGRSEVLTNRRREGVSSSPPPEEDDSEPDEYVHGSFVVDDDAEISYLTSSES